MNNEPKKPRVRAVCQAARDIEDFLYGKGRKWTDKDENDAFFKAAELRDSRSSMTRRSLEE